MLAWFVVAAAGVFFAARVQCIRALVVVRIHIVNICHRRLRRCRHILVFDPFCLCWY